jgi:hypothetical protein
MKTRLKSTTNPPMLCVAADTVENKAGYGHVVRRTRCCHHPLGTKPSSGSPTGAHHSVKVLQESFAGLSASANVLNGEPPTRTAGLFKDGAPGRNKAGLSVETGSAAALVADYK